MDTCESMNHEHTCRPRSGRLPVVPPAVAAPMAVLVGAMVEATRRS